MKKIRIFQGGTDGFGHQLEGTLHLISLSLNNKAYYDYRYPKQYSFEHRNFKHETLINYLSMALDILAPKDAVLLPFDRVIFGEGRCFHDIVKDDEDYENTIYLYDGVYGAYSEPMREMEKSLPALRNAFVYQNTYLPSFLYDDSFVNVCCHIRLGDAIGRPFDYENLFAVVRKFQTKNDRYRVIVHSDGDVSHLTAPNTFLCGADTDVLQVFGDFVHSDVLIITYSSLSLAAHLLGDDKQMVIVPDRAGPTFPHRILEKCVHTM